MKPVMYFKRHIPSVISTYLNFILHNLKRNIKKLASKRFLNNHFTKSKLREHEKEVRILGT